VTDLDTDVGYKDGVSSRLNMAFLKNDGSILTYPTMSDTPTDNGYYKIISLSSYDDPNRRPTVQPGISLNFIAFKPDGTITCWGQNDQNQVTDAPTDNGYVDVIATWNYDTLCGIKYDGSLTFWGQSLPLEPNATNGIPTESGSGYTNIVANANQFAAIKEGTIYKWGYGGNGSTAPSGNTFIKLIPNPKSIAGLKADGSISTWGEGGNIGGYYTSTGGGYKKIVGCNRSFAALHSNGTITCWGDTAYAGTSPSGSGFKDIFSNEYMCTALKYDGTLISWGYSAYLSSGDSVPTGNGYKKIYSNSYAMTALKNDGSISSWGHNSYGGQSPSGTGYVDVFSGPDDFVFLKADGTVHSWNTNRTLPQDTGYYKVFMNYDKYVAMKSFKTIHGWGSNYGGYNNQHPTDYGYKDLKIAKYKHTIALHSTGTISAWGGNFNAVNTATTPTDDGYYKIYNTAYTGVALKDNGNLVYFTHTTNTDYDNSITDGKCTDEIVTSEQSGCVLKTDGSLASFSNTAYDTSQPIDSNYIKLVSAPYGIGNFAGLKHDGSISGWGDTHYNGTNNYQDIPTTSGWKDIISTFTLFCALHSNGTISSWGTNGQYSAPTTNGWKEITHTDDIFIAINVDTSIAAWGKYPTDTRLVNVPTGTGFTSTVAFASNTSVSILKQDGSIVTWGQDTDNVVTNSPTGTGYIDIVSGGIYPASVAALNYDGTITTWGGDTYNAVTNSPTDSGYIKIVASNGQYIALNAYGTAYAWGQNTTSVPTNTGYTDIIPHSSQYLCYGLKEEDEF
jgi:hypothetical protein